MTIDEMVQPVLETLGRFKCVDGVRCIPVDREIRCRVSDTRILHQLMCAFNNGSYKWNIHLWDGGSRDILWVILELPKLKGKDLKNELDYKVCMLKQELGV